MRGKGAGLRTHVLIGMGSALFMIVSINESAKDMTCQEFIDLIQKQ